VVRDAVVSVLGGKGRLAMDKPVISVIVPVYNVEKYIRQCVESVRGQTYTNLECILVDDGSPDSSIQIAKDIVGADSRFRIVTQENAGLGAARNTGIATAQGDFLTFLDSDDWLDANFLEILQAKQVQGDFDVVSARYTRVSERGDFISRQVDQPLPDIGRPLTDYEKVLGVFVPSISCARLYRLAFLRDIAAAFPPTRVPHEDMFFTYKVLHRAERLAEVDSTFYQWRQRENSLSSTVSEEHLAVPQQLRRDTLQYLSDFGGTSFQVALSARRNLTLIRTLRQRIQNSPSETQVLWERFIQKNLNWMVKDYRLFNDSPVGKTYLAPEIRAICNDAASVAPGADAPLDFVFFPMRSYHLRECTQVTTKLRHRGFNVAIVATDGIRNEYEVTKAAEADGIDLISLGQLLGLGRAIRTVVFFNDWDPLMRIISQICTDIGIPTVGWVEGIQDYEDVDTGRKRYPYKRSDHVVLPGAFDRRYFLGTGQRTHLGTVVRIGTKWHSRVAPKQRNEAAIINTNFTYGVLEDKRDEWLTGAVKAARLAGLDPVISQHPFDKNQLFPELVSAHSFDELIYDAAVSIQRFASGILEALAAGTPVIYYNPHGEKVDKFADPRGAYLIAHTPLELQQILKSRSYFWDQDKAQAFLEVHAGLLGKDKVPADHTADILVAISEESGPGVSAFPARLQEYEDLHDVARRRQVASTIDAFYWSTYAEPFNASKYPDLATINQHDMPGIPRPAFARNPAGQPSARKKAEKKRPIVQRDVPLGEMFYGAYIWSRENAPMVHRAAQFAVWGIRKLRRHAAVVIPYVLVSVLLMYLSITVEEYLPAMSAWIGALAMAFIALMVIIIGFTTHLIEFARGEILERLVASESELRNLERIQANSEKNLRGLISEEADRLKEMNRSIQGRFDELSMRMNYVSNQPAAHLPSRRAPRGRGLAAGESTKPIVLTELLLAVLVDESRRGRISDGRLWELTWSDGGENAHGESLALIAEHVGMSFDVVRVDSGGMQYLDMHVDTVNAVVVELPSGRQVELLEVGKTLSEKLKAGSIVVLNHVAKLAKGQRKEFLGLLKLFEEAGFEKIVSVPEVTAFKRRQYVAVAMSTPASVENGDKNSLRLVEEAAAEPGEVSSSKTPKGLGQARGAGAEEGLADESGTSGVVQISVARSAQRSQSRKVEASLTSGKIKREKGAVAPKRKGPRT